MVFNLLIDSDAVRHTFRQHGPANSKFEAARGQIPIQEQDILALAEWLPTLTSVAAGQVKPGKQPRVEATRVDNSGTTVVVLEWRPSRQQLALVTVYKKRPAT